MYGGTSKPCSDYDRLYAALVGCGYGAEEAELMAAGALAVAKTVRIARGVGKYKAYDWLRETRAHQQRHAFEHARKLLRERLFGEPATEPHAEHILTRFAIEQALLRREAAEAPGKAVQGS